MYLGNPLLPVNFTAKSAAESVRKELEKLYWIGFELKAMKLDLIPYFLFNYHYYIENPDSGKSIIKKATHGILAVDGHAIVVREDLVELIKHNWKKGSPSAPKFAFDEKWCNIEKREQDAVLALKTAEHFNVPKDNVVVSSPRKVFVPFYKTSVELDGTKYNLTINGVDGTIEELHSIPYREKGYLEVTRETINDLKDPASWLKYSRDAIVGSFQSAPLVKKHAVDKAKKIKKNRGLAFLESEIILIIIMVLAAILIIFSFLKIRLF